jgi:hypothetical protein
MTDSQEYAEQLVRAESEERSEQYRRGEIGFVPGTRVHTRDGLRGIEKIRVGDLLLTADSPGAELAFRPVVRITHAPARIVRVIYREPAEENRYEIIDTTLNHLFWVIGDGWTEARKLRSGFGKERRLLLPDKREMVADYLCLVVATGTEGIGWISGFANAMDVKGEEWNFASGALHRADAWATEDVFDASEAPFFFDVYEPEVEGSGIFFVGKEGLMVRHHVGIPLS